MSHHEFGFLRFPLWALLLQRCLGAASAARFGAAAVLGWMHVKVDTSNSLFFYFAVFNTSATRS